MKLGALEAGGTKMVCAIGDETGKIYEQVSIATTTPEETIPKLIAYFQDKQIDALGIASFGPVELDPASEKYGYITTTSKLAWTNFDFLGSMKAALKCPMGFDTDVNGSVLGEVTFGQAKGKHCVMYLTGSCCTVCFILRQDISSSQNGIQTIMKENAPITRIIVWKEWRLVLP